MRQAFLALSVVLCGACAGKSDGSYLYVWAGDRYGNASDFLAVIDANPSSTTYGGILASVATGEAGTHPHHTEAEVPATGHLLANGFHAGRTWLFDVTHPLSPKILSSFGDLEGYSHPHSYVRLANGNVLATFQYRARAGAGAMPAMAAGCGMPLDSASEATGGLVEMDERGKPVRSGSAADTSIADRLIYPYSVLPLPSLDRALSTTTDMNDRNVKATSEWLQVWKLSDLSLLRSVALKPGPRGDENKFTGEPRLLPDGRSVYIHTFNCGLYLVRGVERPEPDVRFVWGFEGKNCGVPILAGHYWLQTVPDAHAVVVLDVSDAERPREVSRLAVGDDEQPHWLAIDRTGRRVVMSSAGAGTGNRLFVLNLDPASGTITFDDRFRDPGATRPGITLNKKPWPHGFSGTPVPHGTVFSR